MTIAEAGRVAPSHSLSAFPKRHLTSGAYGITITLPQVCIMLCNTCSSLALRGPQSTLTGHSTPRTGWKGWTVVQPEQIAALD